MDVGERFLYKCFFQTIVGPGLECVFHDCKKISSPFAQLHSESALFFTFSRTKELLLEDYRLNLKTA